MSNAYLSPILQDAQFNDDCTFLAGGLIWFYQAGTSTPVLAYTGPDAATAWTNPIVLDQRGESGGEIWLKAGTPYKMILEGPPQYGQTNGTVISSFDNITGVNDPGTTTIQNWIAYAGTPTYINSTSFSVSGDQRTIFLGSRRLKMQNNDSTTFYGTVVSSTYASSITTVTVSPDFGQSVSSNISGISYGFIETGAVSSIPISIQSGSAAGESQYQLWINYDGTNLKWSKDSDLSSAEWPITADKATAAAGPTFSTQTATTEADVIARMTGVNDAYLYNNATAWGINSVDGGGIFYTRSTAKWSYAGFTLPDPSAGTTYFKLPNGMIIQYGLGTASSAGVTITFPITFPNSCQVVIPANVGTTHVTVSYASPSTSNFIAYAASSVSISYVAIGY